MMPPREKETIVVCGATGQQGAWVLDALATQGDFRLVVFSRNPASERARALAARGVTVRRGDLLDVDSLARIFDGAHGVFGVTQPWSPNYRHVDVVSEVAQGRNVIDACARAGVSHLVLSTAMTIGEDLTGLRHIDSKLQIERYLKTTKVPHTLLRPGTFMDNIGQPFFPVTRGKVRGFAAGDAKLPFISCRDVGAAAAVAFGAREAWLDKAVNLMSEHVSGEDLCATLGKLRKETFRYAAPPMLLMRVMAPEFFKMRRALEAAGRPPYPYRSALQRALEDTRRMVSDVWSLQRYFEASGLVERAL